MAITLTDANFNELVINNKTPILVDFWAPWCGPCLSLAPIINDLANDPATKVRVAKINTDENPHISSLFQIMSIPTLLLFVEGKLKAKIVPSGKVKLQEQINSALAQ